MLQVSSDKSERLPEPSGLNLMLLPISRQFDMPWFPVTQAFRCSLGEWPDHLEKARLKALGVPYPMVAAISSIFRSVSRSSALEISKRHCSTSGQNPMPRWRNLRCKVRGLVSRFLATDSSEILPAMASPAITDLTLASPGSQPFFRPDTCVTFDRDIARVC
jgi:hypothetical protein